MFRRLRTTACAVLPSVLIAVAAPAHAKTIPGCDNPADSALNQYCPTIPSAGGKQRPLPGTRALAGSLSAPALHRVQSSSVKGARRLLKLPAAKHISSPSTGTSQASTSGTSWWLIMIAILLAIAIAGGMIADRRRHLRHQPE